MGYLERISSGGVAPSANLQCSGAAGATYVPDFVFAVMGPTGAGKSSFIRNVYGDRPGAPGVGEKLESYTESPTPYEIQYRGKRIVLIDNPGFGDTYREEGEILTDIAGFLAETYRNGVKLSGIIYLHDITKNRQSGEGRANLKIFKLLIGDEPLRKLILATTRWHEADTARANERLQQLKEDPEYWGDMIEGGSRTERLYDSRHSAFKLLDMFLDDRDQNKVTLEIQDEMVRRGRDLKDTAAGKSLNEQLAAVIAKLEAEYGKKEEELKRKLDNSLHEIKKEQATKLKKKVAELRRQQEILNQDDRENRRVLDMQLQRMKREAQLDTMSFADMPDTMGEHMEEPNLNRSRDSHGRKTKKSGRQHHYYYDERHQPKPSIPNSKQDKVQATQSDAVAEADKLLMKQVRRDDVTRLLTAAATAGIAGGLSVINPTAIPVAVLGGIDTIKCIAAFFQKKRKVGPKLMEDTLEKALNSNADSSVLG